MGFLLFAARKLQLKSKINHLSFENMQLNQEQEKISQQIAQVQQQQNQIKNSLNIFSTMANGAINMQQAAAQMSGLNANSVFSAYNQSYQTNAMVNVMDSIFQAQNNVQLAQLNAKDSEIQTKIASNDSQLELLQAEYQAVKKSESNEVQDSVSHFGLA